MPPKPLGRCSSCGARSNGRCAACSARAEQIRGGARTRGYDRGHERFRAAVLRRDRFCVLCRERLATDADHWPLSRRELVDRGMDPNDPRHGRGLCGTCHKRETAANQPGGWNRPD